jgi:hypothetical protein
MRRFLSYSIEVIYVTLSQIGSIIVVFAFAEGIDDLIYNLTCLACSISIAYIVDRFITVKFERFSTVSFA